MADGFGRISIETSRSVYTIDEIAERVRPVAQRFKVSKVYVYGAYAKGEADSGSDVELLVDFGKAFGYFGRGERNCPFRRVPPSGCRGVGARIP